MDGNSMAGFSSLDNGIELQAKDGHNACIRLPIDINTNYSYAIDFDYYSKGVIGDFKTAFIYDGSPLTVHSEPRMQNTWHHVTLTPSAPEGAKRLTLYLYSGTNRTGTAGVTYRNFTIRRSPRTFLENLLITGAIQKKDARTAKVSSQEVAPHLYSVKASSAKTDFFIHFVEPYHKGWQLSVNNNGREAILPHTAVNMYTNGWYVDVDRLCRQQQLCKPNPDGSYDIEFAAVFRPQRWFYVGSAISAVMVLGSAVYLVVYVFRRARQETGEDESVWKWRGRRT